jgi:hypothetical protein
MARNAKDDFMARYKIAKARADEWSALLEACFYYAVPFRNRFYKPTNFQGDFANAYLYDSICVEATKTFVSKIHSVMCPPQIQWGYLQVDLSEIKTNPDGTSSRVPTNIDPDDVHEAQAGLNEYMRKLFRYIHKSNFDVVANEAFFDMAVGTGHIVCNPHNDKNPLLYTSIPIDQLSIEEALDGQIRTWFRTWQEIKINEIKSRWVGAKIPDELAARSAADPNARIKIIEGETYDPNNLEFPYTYSVYADGCSTDEAILSVPLKINKGVTWRFQKTNNEWWGRGPVMEALPATMRANEMAKIEFASANLNVFRPYMGFSDNVFNPNTFKLKPMTVIPIAPIGAQGQVPLIPLPDSSNPQFGQMTLIDLRTQINNLLYADPLGPVDAPARTATELALRQQNLAEKIGPLFTRLQQELLWPILRTTMHTLDEMGILKMPQYKGIDIQFEYLSPLSLAKGQQDMAILAQYIQMMQGIVGPDVTQLFINNQDLPFLAAEALQLDTRYLNSKEKIAQEAQKLKDGRDEMAMQQMNQMQQGAPQVG